MKSAFAVTKTVAYRTILCSGGMKLMGNMNQDTSAAALRMKAYIDAHIRDPITAKQLLRRSKAAEDYFSYCEEFGCTDDETGNSIPWETVSGIKEALYEPDGIALSVSGISRHGLLLTLDIGYCGL